MSQHAELIAALHRHGVEFIVVGGLAAVIQGAPVHTLVGVLDLLGTIEESTGYADLLGDSELIEIAGFPTRVLSLERLISVKEKLTRPKDRLMLTILRATLDERRNTPRWACRPRGVYERAYSLSPTSSSLPARGAGSSFSGERSL